MLGCFDIGRWGPDMELGSPCSERGGVWSRGLDDKERVLGCGSSSAVSLWSLIGVLPVSVIPLVSALYRDSYGNGPSCLSPRPRHSCGPFGNFGL